MKRYDRCFLLFAGALLAALLAGCGYRAEEESSINPYAAVTSMEKTPVVDYPVPEMSANVLVDLRGYPAFGKKKAALKGSSLPETFRIVDADTGEAVYQGSVGDVYFDQKLGLYLGSADFSDFAREGRYYLECDRIGMSYPFPIRERYYQELLEENCGGLMEECRTGALAVGDAVNLLVAFEWYGSAFPDENGDQVPDLLEALKAWVTRREAMGVAEEETELYAAFLAKFGYNYQGYDRQYATDCLKRASTVFGQEAVSSGREGDRFFALTELYRATGLRNYRAKILEYKGFFQEDREYIEEAGYLYGSMTYLVTRQSVDVEMCELFMGNLMDRAEEISTVCEDWIAPGADAAREGDPAKLLKSAVQVSCANYVMNIYQYNNIIEEFLHYLMGENFQSESFYEQAAERSGYLLLLAQLAEKELDLPQK